MKDLIIIGAGMAGMAAASYSSGFGLSIILLEGATCGGKVLRDRVIKGIPFAEELNGRELAAQMLSVLEARGIGVTYDRAVEVAEGPAGFTVTGATSSYEGRGIIIATGGSSCIGRKEKSIPSGKNGMLFGTSAENKGKYSSVVLPDGISTDGDGNVITDSDCRTEIRGIFAAGGIRGRAPSSVVTALSDGIVAAWQAAEYLAVSYSAL